MKARVKATGRIIQVMNVMDEKGNGVWEEISDMTNRPLQYSYNELEFLDMPKDAQERKSTEPDYWEKLKHQYAGMFFKSFLDKFDNTTSIEKLMDNSIKLAKIFINKLKEDSQCEK